MKIQRFVAPTAHQALNMIRSVMGPDAVILSNRRVDNGVEIKAGLIVDEVRMENIPKEEEVLDILNLMKSKAQQQQTEEPEQAPVIQASEVQIDAPAEGVSNSTHNEAVAFVKGLDGDIHRMQQEIVMLRSMLEGQLQQKTPVASAQKTNPQRTLVEQRLTSLGFDQTVLQKVFANIDFSQDIQHIWRETKLALQTNVLTSREELLDRRGVFAIIGATGVGKTTTIAKLATQFVLKYGSEELGLIAADFNRPAAKDQLWLYGKVLNADVELVSNAQELKYALHKLRHKRLVLIDTAGVGQHDNVNVAKLLELLNNESVTIKSYLALPATSQSDVLKQTIKAFSANNLEAALITKLDEASSMVAVLNAVITQHLPIAYVTDGQSIVKDIARADAQQLINSVISISTKETTTDSIAVRGVNE